MSAHGGGKRAKEQEKLLPHKCYVLLSKRGLRLIPCSKHNGEAKRFVSNVPQVS